MYPAELVKPMREHLTQVGFEELHTAEAVDTSLAKSGTTLIVVNSVCGCAAANARPGAIMSLSNDKRPAQTVTVFAGVDKEAVDKARAHMVPFPPSSPYVLSHIWSRFLQARLVWPCLKMESWYTC